MGSANPEVAGNAPVTGARRKIDTEKGQKQRQAAGAWMPADTPVGSLWRLSSAFRFSDPEAFTGVDLGSLSSAALALEAPQSHGLLVSFI